MPLLYSRQLNEHTILGAWSITERTDELLLALPAGITLDMMLEQAHPRRQKEWLASRVLVYSLLQQFTSDTPVLQRNAHGKPVFEQAPYFVSISHSPGLAAVILSDKFEVGIDVELLSEKALRVADKFLSEAEKEYTCGEADKTCLYWSAKETLYKMYSQRQLIFKENLLLQPSPETENLLLGCVQTDKFSKLYQVQHEVLQQHILTYCIDNSTNKL
ncbi:4'-phosphopantetheinyl transferase superfamily protein [Pontibacter sp. KCTC 32443]|uniref:4'-phosphopantetheinyl transferase superfamily protein n=1 Tax=Pontibacter TaxID=323449 RepID=UPI00164CEDB0|nr:MULTISPECIES: 4'-phosphopantetheinyl transferase superfamily protein [Pontibacter]MBC5773881.1 4'-phosphopantetheinyl transferase superfamily protein [Pontibacter sp. KCTC 32443]